MKTSPYARAARNGGKASEGLVDLHMHSTLSDGALDVKALIRLCRERGLSAIAITDHDNIDSFEEGREYAETLGIEFIPGVEISSSVDGTDIHILGYLFDPTHLRLNRTLVDLREKRKVRAQAIVRKLNEMGVCISCEQVMARAKEGAIGRAHIATLLVEEEYVDNFGEAFRRYLSRDVLEDTIQVKLEPEQAVRLILEAGGVPVLAHPAKTNRDDLIGKLVDAGLMGIETYCHGLNASSCNRYRDLARKYNLVCSGGTDFHFARPDGRNEPGKLKVPYKVLSMLKDLRERHWSLAR